jgi:hypothetical protein
MASPEVKLKLTDDFVERAWQGWCKKTGQLLNKKDYVGEEYRGRKVPPEIKPYCYVAVNLDTFESRLAKLTD